MENQPRVDPVTTELVAGVKSNDDSIATSFVLALANIMRNTSQSVWDKAREACIDTVSEALKTNIMVCNFTSIITACSYRGGCL